MKIFTFKLDQNGGEYHGYMTIKSKEGQYRSIDFQTFEIDGIEIKFDEPVELVSIE